MAAHLPQILPHAVNYYREVRSSSVPNSSLKVSNSQLSTASFSETYGVVTSVPVRVAHELLQAGHHFLDVRTNDEYSAGHVIGAVNVPFMLKLGPGMTRNPEFAEQVLHHFGRYDEIIVGCQLGKRSIMAASELLSIGFTGITDMAGGYDVWVQNGLPSTE